jgi:hypothetical protein
VLIEMARSAVLDRLLSMVEPSYVVVDDLPGYRICEAYTGRCLYYAGLPVIFTEEEARLVCDAANCGTYNWEPNLSSFYFVQTPMAAKQPTTIRGYQKMMRQMMNRAVGAPWQTGEQSFDLNA